MAKGKHNSKPDFSDFEDWCVNKFHEENELSTLEKNIVQRNIDLLLDIKKWNEKLALFEKELNKIIDEKERETERQKFTINFYGHAFKESYIIGSSDILIFPCNVSFTRANFEEATDIFRNTKFKGDAGFHNTKFSKEADFFNAKFKKFADFTHAKFKGRVLFTKATFNSSTSFLEAEFNSERISFLDAKIEGDFIFTPKKEELKIVTANFNDMKVGGDLYIYADFEDKATFQRLDVKGSANFSGSSFKKVPDFRDMKLDRPPEVAGMEVPPETLKMGFVPFAKYSGDKDDVAKYRKLKSMAIAASDHVKDGEFFAYEMMAKREAETKAPLPLLFNYLYGLLSGYGQSYIRPLVASLVLWAGFAFINASIVFKALGFLDGAKFVASLSFYNISPLISSISRFAPSTDGYKIKFQTTLNSLEASEVNTDLLTNIGIAEQFLGAILLFLFLLGLRNAFRLK